MSQNKDDKQAKEGMLKTRIDNKRIVFEATTILPSRAPARQLQRGYTLRISGDSLISDLPYAGRSTSPPIGNTDVGIKFTSTDYQYEVKDRKKGGWIINIKPVRSSDVREMILTIFKNGSASLNVVSLNRDYISYDGQIIE